ncbi:uncharacterized protein LOC126790096 [Argentina anserina]|uniref:uncharacterized protein LOC126790096 n=1 Tax=Argentina anserina TaxID=57926 RepID=UPI00217670D8|nr:uncharacterized protein LOC126790096 [Potentilla anserina]
MPKSPTRTQDTLSPSLLAFKPRQVLLLANSNLPMKQSNPNSSPDHKGPLLHAVAKFLKANGFSKTLKKFLSEAPIEKNGMKDSSLDLEEMCCKYSEMCNKGNTSENSQKENGNDPAPEKFIKPKDMKKNKKISEVLDQGDEQVCVEETQEKFEDKKKKKKKLNDANEISETIADENLLDVKTKVKKNKKKSSGGKDEEVVAMGDASDTVLKKEGFKISDVDATDDKENKSSRKRKRLDCEENDSVPGKSKEDECSEKSSMQKSIKKQRNGSTEPKKAFQRVKLDDVVFTDEKLKDNSYWAKDGAEIGYGAKAQEILGQVKGRDFRHEKTKKKRGTYRGGQIDLQSHSVKFNYSDED